MVALRVGGFLLGTGHVIGYVMYAPFHSPFAAVPGIALVLLAVLPTQKLAKNIWSPILIAVTVCVAYIATGFPFLREGTELDVRAMLLAELVLIVLFLAPALLCVYRRFSNILPK